jgi:hypothetical protein
MATLHDHILYTPYFRNEILDTIVTDFQQGLKSLSKHDPTIETGFGAVTSQKYRFEIYRAGDKRTGARSGLANWALRRTFLIET